MPLPKPEEGESQSEFMERCMHEAMKGTDDQDQAVAMCINTWREEKGERQMEWRSIKGADVRAVDAEDGPHIEGYAAVFNKLSQPLGLGFRERIHRGAFTKTIKDGDVRALFNHDPNHVLGRTTAGTLTLREDEKGLFYSVRPPDQPWVRALVESIKRGDISQSSFAFQAINEEWGKSEKQPIREVREVQLFDVSPVTYPAYLETVVQARSWGEINQLFKPTGPAENHPEERAEPEEIHSDNAEPAEGHSDEIKVRKLSVLIKEHRIERERGK